MKSIKKLLYFFILILVFNDVSGQKPTTIPPEVNQWMRAELQKGENKKPLSSYHNDDLFFSTDSATVVGYLKGYKRSEGFKTGMIYMENEFSRIDHPVVVKIFEDGRFKARIPMWYPKIVGMDFNNQWLSFYIEPGQALGLVIDWMVFRKNEKPETIQFHGPLAAINRNRHSIPVFKTDPEWLTRQARKVDPVEFKKETLKVWDDQSRVLDSILLNHRADEKQKALAHAELNVNMLMRLHGYAAERANERTSGSSNMVLQTELPPDFYDFINRISPEDNGIFVPDNFNFFITQMEYGPLVKAANLPDSELWMNGIAKVVRLGKARDSIAHHELYLRYGKLYDLIRLHRLYRSFDVDLRTVDKDSLVTYCSTMVNGLYSPFYRRQGEIIVNEGIRRNEGRGVPLPVSYAGALFKELIAPYAGKMIFVDFWSTTCGSCISDIQSMNATREKFKNSKDFVFLFITSKDESPKRAYQSFVQKQHLENTIYLSGDDYRYLRELFGIYGIPAYAIVSKTGEILNRKSEPHEFMTEIKKLTL